MPPEGHFSRLADALGNTWRAKARPEQLAPIGTWWAVWLILSGRGWGKTRTGAEWVQEQITSGACRRMALVAATAGDVRDVIVEGPSGLLAIAPENMRPTYEPSKRRLTWPSGAIATTFSADEPERLRGPEFDGAWCDEAGAWTYPEAWDQLQFGLRIGKPRCIVTTTPRPTKLIRDLLSREGNDVVVTRGKTLDNAANLSPAAVERLVAKYGGTRLGRQELDGELLEDTVGALWKRSWLDRDRVDTAPDLTRIVVAVDPAVSSHEGSDLTGIIVAGRARDGQIYVLSDVSDRMSPSEWARRAIGAYEVWKADRIVAEKNQGGDLVENTLRNINSRIPFKAVHASRGKVTRAEPVSTLYEQGRVHHVGTFHQLEDQMCAFTSDFDRSTAGYSPDRVDALVWALTEIGELKQPLVVTDEMLERFSRPGPFTRNRLGERPVDIMRMRNRRF